MNGRWNHLLKGGYVGRKQVYVKKSKLLLWAKVWDTWEITKWKSPEGVNGVEQTKKMSELKIRIWMSSPLGFAAFCFFVFAFSLDPAPAQFPIILRVSTSMPLSQRHHLYPLPQYQSVWIRLFTGLCISIFFLQSTYHGLKLKIYVCLFFRNESQSTMRCSRKKWLYFSMRKSFLL